jgi:hypothetical protein
MLYLGLKFSAYRTYFSKRPTSKEIWEYSFDSNEIRGRNAKAFKYVGILLFLAGILCVPITPNPLVELKDASFMTTILKMLLLITAGTNFMARNVLYEEGHKENDQFAFPLLEIIAVFLKTGWFVRGLDIVSIVVNLTTSGVVIIIIFLFYIN